MGPPKTCKKQGFLRVLALGNCKKQGFLRVLALGTHKIRYFDPLGPPGTIKDPPRMSQGSPREPPRAPKGPQMIPKGPHMTPKGPQMLPKWFPRVPKDPLKTCKKHRFLKVLGLMLRNLEHANPVQLFVYSRTPWDLCSETWNMQTLFSCSFTAAFPLLETNN